MAQSPHPAPTRHRLAILGAAVLFSTGGAAIKACALTGWQVAALRSGVAALVLLLLLPSARRGWSWRTCAVGLAYAATMILFVLGNKLTTAANTIFLQSTAPLYVLVLAPWLLRERISRKDVVLMLAIAGGLALFFLDLEPRGPSAPMPLQGNILGVAAGLSWALTLLGLRWLERRKEPRSSSINAVVIGNLIAMLLCAPFAFPFAATSASDWLLIGYLGAFQIGLAYVLLTFGFRRVGAFEASLLILLEPTLSPLWAWLFQREVPGGWALLGGAIILTSSTVKTWLGQRKEAP